MSTGSCLAIAPTAVQVLSPPALPPAPAPPAPVLPPPPLGGVGTPFPPLLPLPLLPAVPPPGGVGVLPPPLPPPACMMPGSLLQDPTTMAPARRIAELTLRNVVALIGSTSRAGRALRTQPDGSGGPGRHYQFRRPPGHLLPSGASISPEK